MNTRTQLTIVLVLGIVAGIGIQLQWHPFGAAETSMASMPAAGGRKILYWKGPMNPDYHSDKPGKSPMGMDLVPVYADEAGAEGVKISPVVENNLGVRTALVKVGEQALRIEATGYVEPDEDVLDHVHLYTSGWIRRLAVTFAGDTVRRGQKLFDVYSPDVVNAEKEYLQAQKRGNAGLLAAASEKLRALGMTSADIARLAKHRKVSQTMAVNARQSGVLLNLKVREGMFVKPNVEVMSIADLSSVWMFVEVFEPDVGLVSVGEQVEARLVATPGRVWTGRVDYVYPVLNPVTRTLKVRLRFDNPERILKPGMYARAVILAAPKAGVLQIPEEALIRGGERDRVVLALGDGRYTSQEVRIGRVSNGSAEILAGLQPDQRVVTSAQFLIDSEAGLAGSFHRLDAEPDDAVDMKPTQEEPGHD